MSFWNQLDNRSRPDSTRLHWNGTKVSMEATLIQSTASLTVLPTTSCTKMTASTKILASSEDCNSSSRTRSR